MRPRNPFERNTEDCPLLVFLVEADVVKKAIDDIESYENRLLQLSKFDFIEIVYATWPKPQIGDIVKNSGFNFIRSDEEALITPDYRITLEHSKGLSGENSHRICAEQALDLVRILLVNRGVYYVQPRYKVNEGLYYTYRFKKLFSAYQRPWSIAVYGREKSIPVSVYDQLSSMSQRLEFLCRAADKVSYFSLKNPDNDTQRNALYHLGYFVMLTTGIFDDLAWIANHLYSLDLKRHQITLRVKPNKEDNDLTGRLREVNHLLSEYLIEPQTQETINLFYPIRDSLQHGQFLQGMRYSNMSERYEVNLFTLDGEEIVPPSRTHDVEWLNQWGIGILHHETEYIDPYVFVTQSTRFLSQLTENVLGYIDWDEYVLKLDTETQEKIALSDERYREGVWRLLRFGREPLYF